MRILIAEDDEALAKFVRQGLEGESYTVDVYADGEQARAAATDKDYDVIILDLNLPKLDGVAVLRHLRSKKPSLPVLILTQRTKVEDRVQCLDIGADDYVPKQLSSNSLDILHIRPDLVNKIRAAAASRHPRIPAKSLRKPAQFTPDFGTTSNSSTTAVVAIGISTGGPKALQEILPLFPRDFSLPILIVQHMPLGFTGPFAQRLNGLCALNVREATHHDSLQPGVVYIAPAGLHMTVERQPDGRSLIFLNSEPRDCLHIPSADLLIKSVAETFGSQALGVIMTGMGADGAEGIRAIHRRGGFTIGQDEASCTVYGMPRACAEMGVLSRVVSLLQIPALILEVTRNRKRA
jgi:two-component system chemotaxis response regulator CheB